MDTGNKAFTDGQPIEQRHQRESGFQKVVRLLPARSKDNFLLLFLLLLGISGFAYIFTIPFGENTNKRSLYNKIFNPTKDKSLTSDSLKSNLLKIGTERKANMPVSFNFTMVSLDQDYKISFGDDQSEIITSNFFKHTYRESGTYNVRLLKVKNEKETVAHCEFIVVN